MTVKFGFYDSLNGDRPYNASDINTMFEGLFEDGVFQYVGNGLTVQASPGTMNIIVNDGRAWFNNSWIRNTSSLSIAVQPSHPVLNRIDIVILEFDSSIGVRENSIKILTGTPSSTPVPPVLVHTATLNQYALAEIFVGAFVSQIIQSNITNKIGTANTPYAISLIKEAHTHVSSEIVSGTLDPGRLPVPTMSTLGGVKRNIGTALQFVKGISSSGLLEYGSPSSPNVCDVRLSLSQTKPIITSDLVNQTTLYLHPFKGNRVTLYNGADWSEHSILSPLSLVLTSLPTASMCYDIFLYNNSGTLALEAVAWSNISTRATQLIYQDGVEVKTGGTTRRYVGTIYIDSSKTSSTEVRQVNSTNPARSHVWNRYNQVQQATGKVSLNAHTYNLTTYRKWNNTSEMDIEVVIGLLENDPILFAGGNLYNYATIDVALNWSSGGGILVDWSNGSSSAISAFTGGPINKMATNNRVGLNTISVVEAMNSAGTNGNWGSCALQVSLLS